MHQIGLSAIGKLMIEAMTAPRGSGHSSGLRLDPTLDDGSSKSGNIAQQSAVLLEMIPELFGHGEADF
jgi:hypothetical protein